MSASNVLNKIFNLKNQENKSTENLKADIEKDIKSLMSEDRRIKQRIEIDRHLYEVLYKLNLDCNDLILSNELKNTLQNLSKYDGTGATLSEFYLYLLPKIYTDEITMTISQYIDLYINTLIQYNQVENLAHWDVREILNNISHPIINMNLNSKYLHYTDDISDKAIELYNKYIEDNIPD